jgi:U2-associated protein SR140
VYTQETSQALRQLFMGETTLDELEAAKHAKLAAPSEAKAKLDKPNEELGKTKGFKSSGFKSSFKRVKAPEEEAEDILREALGGAGDPAEDLDGEEMDLDGEEMDLDGEEVDLDGEPMGDDDLDGEPM